MLYSLLFFSFFRFAAAQSVDFYEASASKKVPILVFVHGGAWISGSKEQYKDLAKSLAQQNLCIAVTDYGLAPAHSHPKPIDDLQTAIIKIEKLKSLKCDTQKIFLVGHSAGAHTIAFWSTRFQDPYVKGLIGIEGIYDLPHLLQIWPSYKEAFINAEFGTKNDLALASPSRLKIKSKAPWLILHSAKDELVDLAQADDFYQHLKAEGRTGEYLELKTESHFGIIESLGHRDSLALKKILAFIHQQTPF